MNHASLLVNHLDRILFNVSEHPDRVQASIAELKGVPYAEESAVELIKLLSSIVPIEKLKEVCPDTKPLTDRIKELEAQLAQPVVPVVPTTPVETVDLDCAGISDKLDKILAAIGKPSGSNGEVTSPAMAKLAAKVLNDPKSTKTELSLAGALLTQTPNKSK